MTKSQKDVYDEWLKQKLEKQKQSASTTKLLAHLECNTPYYVQKFLSYIDKRTEKQGIIDFVNQVIASTTRIKDTVPQNLKRLFDVERAYVDGRKIIVPGVEPVNPDQNGVVRIPKGDDTEETIVVKNIPPTVDNDIEIPVSDGVHLEVAAGICVLQELPHEPDKSDEKESKLPEHTPCIVGIILTSIGTILTTTSIVPYYPAPEPFVAGQPAIITTAGLILTGIGSYLLKSCGKMGQLAKQIEELVKERKQS